MRSLGPDIGGIHFDYLVKVVFAVSIVKVQFSCV